MTIQIIYNEYPLNYDSQTGAFTVGNVIYGATSGAYATIRRIDRSGTAGTLYLESITGTFQDNEIIYESAVGSELITNGNMELDSNWADFGPVTSNTRSIPPDPAHGGTYSRKLVIPIAGGGCSQALTTTAGAFYIASGWLYISTLAATGVYFGIRDSEATDFAQSVVSATTTWTNFSAVGMSPVGGVGYVSCAGSGCTGDTTCYLDDVSVKKITNAALANGTVQSPITIDLELTRPGVQKTFFHESSFDRSYSGKVQIINQYGIQEMSFESMFSMATYYKLLAWWSWSRQGKLWAFTMDSTKIGNTTLDGGAASGQKTVPLTATTGFVATDICLLKREDLDDCYEVVVIDSVSAGVSITATDNLNFNYVAGASFKHLDYWPEVVTLDNRFSPTRTGVNSTSGKYWRNTFKFTEAL